MSPRIRAALVASLALCLAPASRADEGLFRPPRPGSYELPPIRRVQDHWLRGPSGGRERMLRLAPGQVALVAFIYRACSDAAGCPAVLATLRGVDAEIARHAGLRSHVRIVVVSFDPEHDTPAKMGELARELAPDGDWGFLTGASREEVASVLADFGQDATRLLGAGGEPTGVVRHVVHVYLVDRRGDVRNVYSTGLLSVPLLLADLETVLAER